MKGSLCVVLFAGDDWDRKSGPAGNASGTGDGNISNKNTILSELLKEKSKSRHKPLFKNQVRLDYYSYFFLLHNFSRFNYIFSPPPSCQSTDQKRSQVLHLLLPRGLIRTICSSLLAGFPRPLKNTHPSPSMSVALTAVGHFA